MKQIRQYIRQVLLESRFKQMSKPKFTDLKKVLNTSSFLDADPSSDINANGWTSEAAEELRDNLNNYFNSKFGDGHLTAVVKIGDSESIDITKDDVLKRAAYEFKNGAHFIEIILISIEPSVEIIGDDNSPMVQRTFHDIKGTSQKVYEVIMHELLHMQQFLKFSRGKPTAESWDQFMQEYKKRGGGSGMGGDYFFFDEEDSPSELETFAYQMANELVHTLGQAHAVKVLQQQHPDYNIIRKNSTSFRTMEKNSTDIISRPELRDMIKRAKQYAKRMDL
jgi:hypothetical protein